MSKAYTEKNETRGNADLDSDQKKVANLLRSWIPLKAENPHNCHNDCSGWWPMDRRYS